MKATEWAYPDCHCIPFLDTCIYYRVVAGWEDVTEVENLFVREVIWDGEKIDVS